jgi:hypothetical protein
MTQLIAQPSQNETFEKTRNGLVGLDAGMSNWSFGDMLDELKHAIESVRPPKESHPIRSFSRRYLGLTGEAFKQVQKWLRGESAMSQDDISRVLKALQGLRNTPPAQAQISVKRNMGRRLVDFTVSQLGSLEGMLSDTVVGPTDINESDKIEIRSSLQKICGRLGICAVFPDNAKYTPVTSKELAGVGLSNLTGGKKS